MNFKRLTEICDHNKTNLKINNNEKSRNSPNIWKLNTILPNNMKFREEITREINFFSKY